MKRKGGMVTWILFIFVLLIGGFMLMVIAGIAMGEGELDLGLTKDVTVEQQVTFTVSSSSALQIPSTVLLTEFSDEKVYRTVEKFAYCWDRAEEMNCDEQVIVSASDLNNAIENRLNKYMEEDILGKKPYFVKVFRNGEEIHTMSRGDLNTLVREGETVPQFEEQATEVRVPLSLPGNDTASIEFHIPEGGLTSESFQRGDNW